MDNERNNNGDSRTDRELMDNARKLYVNNPKMTLRDVADETGLSMKKIRTWSTKYKWVDKRRKKQNDVLKTKEDKTTDKIRETAEVDKTLSMQEEFFCYEYLKCYNATLAAKRAGYSPRTAHMYGHELLKKPKIHNFLKEVKNQVSSELYIDARDVVEYWKKVAFADITDYVNFKTEEIIRPGRTEFIVDPESGVLIERPVKSYRNHMSFVDGADVDGTIISEVSQGIHGVKVKLADKKWAMEKLEKYFAYQGFEDTHKKNMDLQRMELEKERVALMRERLEIERIRAGVEMDEVYESDGFDEALAAAAASVWKGDEHEYEPGE